MCYRNVMFVLKIRLPAQKSDGLSDWLWSELAETLAGIEELPADGGQLFKVADEFEILEFGSEAAKKCAEWLESENFRGRGALIFQLYLNRELSLEESRELLAQMQLHFGGEVEILSQLELPGVDYLEEYKKQVRGNYLNEELWVGPPWDIPASIHAQPAVASIHAQPEAAKPAPVWSFVVEPGLAFGTGEHPTTQLCLIRLLELKKQGYAPENVLDLGTGTGVLALAVKRFFPKSKLVVSDIDPACQQEIQKTFALNQESSEGVVGFFGSSGTAESLSQLGLKFDLIVSNIYAEVLARNAPFISSMCHPASKWLASGILEGASESALDEATEAMFKSLLRRSQVRSQAKLDSHDGLSRLEEIWVLREWQPNS